LFKLGLSGQLWPLHCKPYNDEVLSSWLVRLSRAYGANAKQFYDDVWPHADIWKQDIDKGTDDKFLSMLSAKTATPDSRILATTVRGYKGYRSESLKERNRAPWLLRPSVHAFTRRKPWLQYCPHCLQTDIDPYFRGYWRLAFITVCSEHHRCLLDRCDNCGAVVNFHLLPGDAEAITLCHRCRYDLRLASAPAMDESTEYERLLQLQRFFLATMRNGSCQLGGLLAMPGAPFFDRLHERMQLFLTMMPAPVFKEAFGEYLDASFFDSHLASVPDRSLEGFGVEDRLLFMLFMSWWFDQQPERLIALCPDVIRR